MKNVFGLISTAILGMALLLWGLPTYNVWQQEMAGKARLAESSQSRQIQIEQARGEVEAAKLLAEAIETVGTAAREYPEYRQQKWLTDLGESLANGHVEQTIYIPMNGQIPITEAGRVANK
jgi:regulator of protease activity HflC (stomatin/prohibitin superfamily)